MEVGSIIQYSGSTTPDGYLVCDGSAVSRSDYSDLFDVIGTDYGPGDGSTTFNLPDLSGKVALGVSISHTLASTGGEASHTLLTAEIPSHTHTVPEHGHANTIAAKTPSLSHTITQPVFKYNKPNGVKRNSGSSKSAYSGTNTATASRTTNVAVTAHAAANCTMSGAIANKAAFDSDATGGGGNHNNMQPFMTVNYIISTGD